MALLTRRSAVVVAAALAMAAPLAAAAPAAAETKLKMVLNWKYQGPQGCFSSPTIAATSKPPAST